MARLTVYGTPISTYVRTVRLLLEEAGADYSLQGVGILNGENQSAEYLAKNPFGKVPTLEVDGNLLYETTVITDYLDTTVAHQKFSPADPLVKARMRQIIAIIDNYLYGAAIQAIVIQRLIVPSQGGTTDESKVKDAVAPAQKAMEAIVAGLQKLSTDEVAVRVLHAGVGAITESDITLALASKAWVLGFNVRANAQARELAKRDGVEIRYHSIIYELLDEAKAALSGMLAPTARETTLGHAEIREVFSITKIGKIAGCMVTDGLIRRGARVRLVRDDVVIHDGALGSLKRFKD
ncbi:MAG: hypothetical protein HC772_13960, partial [Leptolyngbyaceae cyanobacterium CRU_2_3]|nr:hypothetical protein [Leptolyngbyaceae cyanobacterium CRU_2_3]